MLERRFRPNLILFFFGVVIFLSTWHLINNGSYITTISNSINIKENASLIFLPNTIDSLYTYHINVLPLLDYKKLMNFSDFEFQIVSNCSDSVFVLVLIHTSPKNYDRRKSIRETWGKSNNKVKILFLLGKVNDMSTQKRLDKENKIHGDFVQGNFVDAYRNMTYKHAMALKYAIYHCMHAKYVIKTDDDVFVNMPTMIDFLTALSPYGAKKLLLCKVIINSPVQRSFRSKWRISFDEIKYKHYPNFCPGWAVLYSQDVVFSFYNALQNTSYFWIDDVLVTGIIAQKENIQHTDASFLILNDTALDFMRKNSKFDKHSGNPKFFLYGPPNVSIKDMYLLWNFVESSNQK